MRIKHLTYFAYFILFYYVKLHLRKSIYNDATNN